METSKKQNYFKGVLIALTMLCLALLGLVGLPVGKQEIPSASAEGESYEVTYDFGVDLSGMTGLFPENLTNGESNGFWFEFNIYHYTFDKSTYAITVNGEPLDSSYYTIDVLSYPEQGIVQVEGSILNTAPITGPVVISGELEPISYTMPLMMVMKGLTEWKT